LGTWAVVGVCACAAIAAEPITAKLNDKNFTIVSSLFAASVQS